MSFAYPSFLWALFALSIPVLIHLFSFRKTQRIYFSSNRFLHQVQQATSARRKLKHYLILASRLLFLFFLILAFAQPYIPAAEQASATRDVVVYLDNSLSMSVPVDEKVRALDAATSFARQLIEVFPPETRYLLLTNDFAPYSNSFSTGDETLDLLTQVRLSPISRSVTEILNRIKNTAGKSATDIFWLSDFQQSTLGDVNPQLAADSTQRLHLVPLTFMVQHNIFADTAWLENPFVVGGEKNSLHVRLRNNDVKAVEQLLIRLTINDNQAGTAMVSIPAKSTAHTTFDLSGGLNRYSRAIVSFNDYPVSFDNELYLALNFNEKIRVMEIKSTALPTVVEKVYGNKALFTFNTFNAGNVNYSAFNEADLVVLNELERIDVPLQRTIQNYVSGGGSLLVIPSGNPVIKDYMSVLGVNSLKRADDAEKIELRPPDFNNPFFDNVFEERNIRLALPAARRVLNWGADRSALLKLKNDQPFLSRFARKGFVYVMASPAHTEYSDFANHSLFLPIMYRIAASGKKVDTRLYYSLAESLITVRGDSLVGEQPARLSGQQEVIPSQRRIGNRLFLELPRFIMSAGFYYVVDRADTLTLLAFNQSQPESLLHQLTVHEVKEKLGGHNHITIFESNSTETFSNEIKARYLGTPLWKYAVLLALTFLLVEVLLIRFLK